MTADFPLVSIVIPAYNHAGYLDEAVRSVLAQDYPHIELIVLDDGSTDGTRRVLEKYDGKFYWETQENMGQVNTLNKGWLMSKGQILSYLSADDTLMPGAVSSSVKCFRENPDAVLTYCDFNLIDPNSRITRRVRTPEYSYHAMVSDIICPPGPGAFFRRTAFEAAGLWNNEWRQMLDYDYWLRLGLHGRFVRIPKVLASYRMHNSSQTFAGTSEIVTEEPVEIVSHFFDTYKLPDEILLLRKQALSNAYLIYSQLNFRTGRFRLGFSGLKKAFSLYPRNLLRRRTARLAANVLFNRLAHKAIWKVKGLISRES